MRVEHNGKHIYYADFRYRYADRKQQGIQQRKNCFHFVENPCEKQLKNQQHGSVNYYIIIKKNIYSRHYQVSDLNCDGVYQFSVCIVYAFVKIKAYQRFYRLQNQVHIHRMQLFSPF